MAQNTNRKPNRLFRIAVTLGCGLASVTAGYVSLQSLSTVSATPKNVEFFVGVICGLLALLGSITVQAFFAGQRQAEETIAKTLHLDPQTGLLSRSGFVEALQEFMKENGSGSDISTAYLIAFEFDSIKDINETYGHEVGDAIIRILADRLKRIVGELGPVSRISGSEYVVAIKATNSERELKIAVGTLIDALSQPIKIGGISMAIFGNAGVVKLAQSTTRLEAAMRCATLARASARDAGRGTWAIYHPEMSQRASYRKWLESELSSALSRNELSLRYQPQVDSTTGRVVGYEALLRWTHHEKGAIAPSEFITIAEECGLIRSIGLWILRQACRDAMQFDPSIKMSVNVSAVQIMDADFPQVLRQVLDEAGLPPERLELEVTESVVISDFTLVRQRFAEIQKLGCPIAIDDF
ncbi:MAG: putative bifunctional diguanylate cyclase/phosphodiesterase, partial [Paracoccus sp. (in: a-proteobacteria)]